MLGPNCPDHLDLALDLAQGRLDDAAATEAEGIRRSCPVCRVWWSEQFEGETAAIVAAGIEAALADLDLPRRRTGHGWLAAAAAVVMALGAGGLWLVQRPHAAVPDPVQRVAVIESFDFESPATQPPIVVTEAAVPEPADVRVADVLPTEAPAQVPAVSDEIQVASAAPTDQESEGGPVPIFAGDFESGDLGGWVPTT
jgi:hypothetical protein